MTRGYVAVGHGVERNGVFDPGAVNNNVREYDLAFEVVTRTCDVLARNGVSFQSETAGGPGHDPDYVGSAYLVNNGRFDWAIEVHFDYGGAPRGGFGLYQSQKEWDWCSRIAHEYQAMRGLITRPNQRRDDLYFLNTTRCPAIIWECDRVGQDSAKQTKDMGTAVGIGIIRWLRSIGMIPGHEGDSVYMPDNTGVVPPQHNPPYVVEPVAADCGTPDGKGWWIVSKDGDVTTFGTAPFRTWETQHVDMAGREVAKIEPWFDGIHPYQITTTTGETYRP